MNRSTVVCLGRYGDVLNALPLARHICLKGEEPPNFVISAEYATLLDSVDYVVPWIYHHRFENLPDAITEAQRVARGGPVVPVQTYGFGYKIPDGMKCESFCEEAYRVAGYWDEFLRGEFDRITLNVRNHDRESRLFHSILPENPLKPIILVNIAGNSSPFAHASDLLSAIRARYSEVAHIVDLSSVRAQRLTDLLALYDRAALLITIDTATLHLAGAAKLPYIALIADTPSKWHGAYTRGNCVLRTRYGKYHNWKDAILAMIRFVIAPISKPIRLIHAYHVPPILGPDTARRNRLAMQTWRTFDIVGSRVDVPMRLQDFKRTFTCDEARQIPYIKDMIDAAMEKATKDGDYIMLCNSDTCFSLDAYSRMIETLRGHPGFCASRRDFPKLDDPLKVDEVKRGVDYAGTDLFVFKPEWWRQVRDQFPDMLLAAEAWDCVLRELILKYGMPLLKDMVYHERHYTRWSDPKHRNTLPMQVHNLKLASEALPKINPNWKPGMFGIR